MKNSFLKIVLVPHDKGQNVWLKIPLFVLILIVLIFILGGFFFFNNLQNFVNVSSLTFLKADNQKLKEKVSALREKAMEFEEEIDSLLKEQEKAFKEHHITANIPESNFYFPPESLLVISRWIDSVFEVTSGFDNSLLRSIPSIMPAKGHIISKFGEKIDPYTGRKKPHKGISILTSLNTPVVSTADGTVTHVGNDRGKGLFVEIRHSCGLVSSYSHLLKTTVKEGQKVKRGSVIGYVGQSGRAPYPYLYYEVRKGKINLDPENLIFGGY
jgi:murein DD-endopeptidase MepM/ murein hydrolase activator NlpD